MATGTRDVESELIESVCERVRERVAPEEAAEAEAFVRAYYRRAPADDLRGREPVDLYGAALSHWTFGRGRAPGRGARARVQPDVRAARLAVAAHGDRHRLRRHAVHRRLGEHGAQPARDRHPRARAPGRRRRVLHAHRGRPPGATGSIDLEDALQGVLAQVRAAVEDWQPMRERMQALVERAARRPASTRPRSRRRGRCWRGCATTTSRSSATASTRSTASAARRRGLRARAAARRLGRRLERVRQAPAARCARWRSSREPLVLSKANSRSHDPPARATSTTSA